MTWLSVVFDEWEMNWSHLAFSNHAYAAAWLWSAKPIWHVRPSVHQWMTFECLQICQKFCFRSTDEWKRLRWLVEPVNCCRAKTNTNAGTFLDVGMHPDMSTKLSYVKKSKKFTWWGPFFIKMYSWGSNGKFRWKICKNGHFDGHCIQSC